MASSRSPGTYRMRPKCGTHSPCLSDKYFRKSSALISTVRRPRSMPKRKNLPKVLLTSDLGNLAIPLSILRRVVLVKRRYVYHGLELAFLRGGHKKTELLLYVALLLGKIAVFLLAPS